MKTGACALHHCPYCSGGLVEIKVVDAIQFFLEADEAGNLLTKFETHPAKGVITFGDGPAPCSHLILASCCLMLRCDGQEVNDTILDIESPRFRANPRIDADTLNYYAHERCCYPDTPTMDANMAYRRSGFEAYLELPDAQLSLSADGHCLFAEDPQQFFDELCRDYADWLIPQAG